MDGVVYGLIAALVGGVSGAISAFLTNLIERRRVIDERVRGVRAPRYSELWRATSLLPKWPRNTDATYEDVLGLSKQFRDWYFGTSPPQASSTPRDAPAESTEPAAPSPALEGPGGMYLSVEAREAYVKLQEAITEILAGKQADELTSPLWKGDYDEIVKLAHALRIEMTTDLLSRRRTFMVR